MSIASTLQDTKARLDSLLSYANETTGQSDVSIGDAIRTLADGFGGGGGDASSGTITMSSADENMVINTGLTSVTNFIVVRSTKDAKSVRTLFGVFYLSNLRFYCGSNTGGNLPVGNCTPYFPPFTDDAKSTNVEISGSTVTVTPRWNTSGSGKFSDEDYYWYAW